MKQIVVLLLIGFCLGSFVVAQDSSKIDTSKTLKEQATNQNVQNSAAKSDWTRTPLFVIAVIGSFIGIAGFIFGFHQYRKRNKIAEEKSYNEKV